MNPPESAWIAIALLGKPRGNRGELTALALSGKPERYQLLREVFLFEPSGSAFRAGQPPQGAFRAGQPPEGALRGAQSPESAAYEVESTWFHDGTLIFKFRGVDSISDAQLLTGAEVRVPLDQRVTLDPGEYFESDLVGCDVVDRRTGESLGRVTRWDDGGSSGLLVVEENLLIPFARSICVEIDPAAKRIFVELPEGLKDLNRS